MVGFFICLRRLNSLGGSIVSTSFLVTIIVGAALAIAVVLISVGVLRFYSERQAQQRQELEQLEKRCGRIADLLTILTDRYLPLTTKVVLVEYLISSISTLTRHKMARSLEPELPGFIQLLEELKIGQQASIKDKVQTHVQLSQVQQGLQSIPLLYRGLVNSQLVDKATAKDQVTQIRFSFCLAHHDLLLKEAEACLELDKKAAALDKLRLALAEMEKVVTFEQSGPVIESLNSSIQRIENELFGKSSRVS